MSEAFPNDAEAFDELYGNDPEMKDAALMVRHELRKVRVRETTPPPFFCTHSPTSTRPNCRSARSAQSCSASC